ncbi:MAG: tRNA (adenosine(37)-N6)-threonylcarbamoyltransferase complex dimerization subunit type 1 TsaB [Mucilaginibacter polytrichastri]|nr:tRNA (adenosine(37)-N6)-threonylcarbamoyltransferase complex dimerization subunit type 1 TsaB [Mucilaginibacter polytrichastri]
MEKTILLHIETATSVCGAAISVDGETVALAEIDQANVHAERLTLLIDEALQQAGFTYKNLAAVSVSAGPGSYTGLRIGTSTAKGLCFALDIPLIDVRTLDAMAAGMQKRGEAENVDFFCPILDARRMEVYAAVYRGAEKLEAEHPEIISENSFAGWLEKGKVLFFGSGAAKCEPLLGAHEHAFFTPDFSCSAADQPALAYHKFLAGDFADLAYFEPFYLKEFFTGKH